MNPLRKWLKVILWVISIAVALGFIVLFFRADALSVLQQLGFTFTLMLVAISIISLLENVLATQVLLSGMGHTKPFSTLYLISTASMPANYTTPGKVGIPIKLYLYKKLLDIPVSTASASMSVNMVIGVLIAAIFAVFGILQLFPDITWVVKSALIAISAVVCVFLLARFVLHYSLFPASITNTNFAQKVRTFLVDFMQSIQRVPLRTLAIFVVLMLIRLALRVLVTYLILVKTGVTITPIDILYIQSISGLVGIFSMLPMGIGAKEISTVTLFSLLDVSSAVATSVATLERILWTVVPLLLGLISVQQLGLSVWSNQTNSEHEL